MLGELLFTSCERLKFPAKDKQEKTLDKGKKKKKNHSICEKITLIDFCDCSLLIQSG